MKKNISDYFSNLKISKKLFLGFSLMLLIVIITLILTIISFREIEYRSQKTSVAIQLKTALEEASVSQVNYKYTHKMDYFNQNNEAIHNLSTIVSRLKEYSWSPEGLRRLKITDEAVKRYLTDSGPFLDTLEQKTQILKNMNSKGIYEKSVKADSLGREPSLSPDIAVKATQFAFVLNDIDSMMSDYRDNPTVKAQQDIQERIKNGVDIAQKLSPLIPIEQQSWVKQSIQDMQDLAVQLPHYDTLWKQQDFASIRLNTRATEVSDAITNIYAFQKEQAAKTIATAETIIVLVSLIGIFCGVLLAYLITLSITRPLNETLSVAQKIARGDLTSTLTSQRHDEPGLLMQAVSTMNQNLKDIIQNVQAGVESVARSSSEIAAGNVDLSSRTEQQSAAVVETAASMEELTSTVEQNAANANYARQLSEQATLKATQGSEISQQVIETMENVRRSSHRISEIISVINGIAFQTNILALNAAVEAAHAGEQGKGFAVVAVEVRNLAQRSSQSSKEIEALIKESAAYVDSGCSLVENAGVAMDEIVTSVSQVRDIMGEIAIATDEQSRGISQIAQAMTEMDTTTQQNAALVVQSSDAASSLEEQAVQLEKIVSVFKISENERLKKPVVSYKLHVRSKAVKAPAKSAEEGWTTF
ncbi:methyl-accepting chemotaxis protein [Rahnella selenatireducens]|uniref:methyl-accepting chemotaxis protein n=1 Tax=Rahnella selenatireducens TaxID=3389797 RepID=UPI0039693FDB